MNLREHLIAQDKRLSRKGKECARIASESGTSPSYIYMVALGHKRPGVKPDKHGGPSMCDRIAQAARCVSREELRPDVYRPFVPRRPARKPKQSKSREARRGA